MCYLALIGGNSSEKKGTVKGCHVTTPFHSWRMCRAVGNQVSFSMSSGEISSFPLHILMQSVQLTYAEQSNYQVNIIQRNPEEPNNDIQVNINCYVSTPGFRKEETGDGEKEKQKDSKREQISTNH